MAMWDIGRRVRRRVMSKGPKALYSRRFGRDNGPSVGVGKAWRCPASPAPSLLPDGPLSRSPWVFITARWYNPRSGNIYDDFTLRDIVILFHQDI